MKIVSVEPFLKRQFYCKNKLSVLEGSSMSEGLPPHNIGEPVNNTTLKKIKYAWNMIRGKIDSSGHPIKELSKEEDVKESIFENIIKIIDDII